MEVVLETKNLCKSFGAVMVNDKINLTLHRGEIMAVLGENGSVPRFPAKRLCSLPV